MAGNEFACSIDAFKKQAKLSEIDLENCVDDATVKRYSGSINIEESLIRKFFVSIFLFPQFFVSMRFSGLTLFITAYLSFHKQMVSIRAVAFAGSSKAIESLSSISASNRHCLPYRRRYRTRPSPHNR